MSQVRAGGQFEEEAGEEPIWLPWALSVLWLSTHLEGAGETEEQGYHEGFGL